MLATSVIINIQETLKAKNTQVHKRIKNNDQDLSTNEVGYMDRAIMFYYENHRPLNPS